MLRAARLVLALGLASCLAAFVVPASAAGPAFKGTCEDLFVPGYPDPEAPGTPTDRLGEIPDDLFGKALADCEKRANGFFRKDAKARMALVRGMALQGDRKALPELLDAANRGVAEASSLIAYLYAVSPAYTPAEPEYAELPRALAEAHLRKAAQSGLADAIAALGISLANGTITKRDLREARTWFLKLESLAKRPEQARRRGEAALELAAIALAADDPPTDDRKRIPELLAVMKNAGEAEALWVEIRARRLGIGYPKDEALARRKAEAAGVIEQVPAIMGEYIALLEASSEAADKVKLAELLEGLDARRSGGTARIAGRMLYDGVPAGRDRQRALALLSIAAEQNMADAVSFAQKAVESGFAVKVPPRALKRLYEAVDLGLPGADVAALNLLESGNTDARDNAKAIALGARLRTSSDAMKLWSLAKVADSGPSALYIPYETPEKAAAALDGFVANNVPEALRIKAVALRKGTLYRQDDVAATQMLIKAAEGGDVPAMLMLADAYARGTGIAEDDDEEIRWIMAAARSGSVEGERNAVWELSFAADKKGYSVHDAVVTGMVLQGDSLAFNTISPGYDRVFIGPKIDQLGADYIVTAVMDGFRASMGLRRDEMVVKVFKLVPKELTLEVEQRLAAEGFLAGEPDGFMGPAARTALVQWARAKGLPEKEADAPPASAGEDYRLTNVPVIAPARIEKIRKRVFAELEQAKSDAAQAKPMEVLQMLAQYGDLPSRLEILRAYAGSNKLKPRIVLGYVTLYGLDALASGLPPEEKVEIDFVFSQTSMARAGQLNTEADVILITLRDDPRFRDFATFNRVADQFIFIGGLCEALGERAKVNKVEGLEADACSGTSRRALMAWAKAAGPAGAEAEARRQAADFLQKLPD